MANVDCELNENRKNLLDAPVVVHLHPLSSISRQLVLASGPGLSWYYLEGYALPQTTQTTSHACLMGQIKDHLPCLLGTLLRNAVHAPGLSLGSGCRWTLGNPLPASSPALLCPSLPFLNAPSFNHRHKNLPPTSRKPNLGRSRSRDIRNPEIRSESARS